MEDAFSKYIWIKPLKQKTVHNVLLAFQSIYQKYSDFPVELSTDKGKEFKNKQVETFFLQNDVEYFSSEGNTKAQFAKCTIRTFKGLMLKYMCLHNTKRYLDILPELGRTYSDTYKYSIKMRPSDVSEKNMRQVFYNLYDAIIPDLIANDLLTSRKHLKAQTLKKNDYVRIQLKLGVFSKRYANTFSGELFQIKKILPSKPVTYQLIDLQGNQIAGSFYQNELQKTEPPQSFPVEKILQKIKQNGVLFYFVKWRDFPSSFNSYIPAESLS